MLAWAALYPNLRSRGQHCLICVQAAQAGSKFQTVVAQQKLRLEKPRIKREWRDRCNRYPITARVTVINQHIAIGRAGDRHDNRRDHKNKFVAPIEPCIPELLRVGLARGPVAWQIAKRYFVRRNIIRDDILHHGLRR